MSAENQNMPYEIYDVKYLPIVSHYVRKLGIVELLDKLVPSEMTVSVRDFVLAMILDTLSGRTPLYHLEQFFEGQNTELLLGKRICKKLQNKKIFLSKWCVTRDRKNKTTVFSFS